MKHKTVWSDVLSGVEVEFKYQPVEGSVLHKVVGANIVVAYLVRDEDVSYLLDDDYLGHLYSSHRHASTHAEMQQALGLNSDWEPDYQRLFDSCNVEVARRYVLRCIALVDYEEIVEWVDDVYDGGGDEEEHVTDCLLDDAKVAHSYDYVHWPELMHDVLVEMWDEGAVSDPDALPLDCYSHGGDWWSLRGQGTQCQWDTARGAGVWVPSDDMREQLDTEVAGGLNRAERRRFYAQQYLDQYNAVNNGDVYGCVCHVFDLNGDLVSSDEVWGYVGFNYAIDVLRSDFLEAMCVGGIENERDA